MTIPKFLRFADLKFIGIANSWAQLKKLQDRHGFPAGRLLSPQVRAWSEAEVNQWLDRRPVEKAPLRGRAKIVTERATMRAETGEAA